jgi:hypothetical protein
LPRSVRMNYVYLLQYMEPIEGERGRSRLQPLGMEEGGRRRAPPTAASFDCEERLGEAAARAAMA